MHLFNGPNTCWEAQGIPDRAWFDHLYNQLNNSIRKAARDAGIGYIIPDHKANNLNSSCGVPGVRHTTTTGLPEGAYPFGPTPTGQAYMANTLNNMWKAWVATHPSLG